MNRQKTARQCFQHLLGFILLSLLPATGLSQDNPFKPFRAEYVVKRDGELIATTRLSLDKTGENRWLYQSHSQPTGWLASMMGAAIHEQSEWQWQDGIKVMNYRYDRSGKEKHVHLKFNWQDMKVTNVINGEPWKMNIEGGTLDKLSINMALRAHLIKSKSDASFPVADGGKLKIYDFKIAGEETVETPLGKITTIKILRNKRGRSDKQATLWLAPDIDYLTIKMEKRDKDDELVTLRISSIH